MDSTQLNISPIKEKINEDQNSFIQNVAVPTDNVKADTPCAESAVSKIDQDELTLMEVNEILLQKVEKNENLPPALMEIVEEGEYNFTDANDNATEREMNNADAVHEVLVYTKDIAANVEPPRNEKRVNNNEIVESALMDDNCVLTDDGNSIFMASNKEAIRDEKIAESIPMKANDHIVKAEDSVNIGSENGAADVKKVLDKNTFNVQSQVIDVKENFVGTVVIEQPHLDVADGTNTEVKDESKNGNPDIVKGKVEFDANGGASLAVSNSKEGPLKKKLKKDKGVKPSTKVQNAANLEKMGKRKIKKRAPCTCCC